MAYVFEILAEDSEHFYYLHSYSLAEKTVEFIRFIINIQVNTLGYIKV